MKNPRGMASAIGLLGVLALLLASGWLRPAESPRSTSPSPPPAATASVEDIETTLTRDAEGCAGVRSTVWHPLSGVDYTGQLRITLPARDGGAIVLFVGDAIPLDVEAETPDRVPIAISRERLRAGPGVDLPPDYWLEDQSPWNAPAEVVRVTVDARGERDTPFVLRLGRRAPRVLARLIGYPRDVAVAVCADPLADGERYFASGWYGEERTPDGAVRWMREHGAILVRSEHGSAARVRIRAAPAVANDAKGETMMTLRVNEVLDLAPIAMRAGFADYEWPVPDEAWVSGTNELFFSVSRVERRGGRTLGMALASLHVD